MNGRIISSYLYGRIPITFNKDYNDMSPFEIINNIHEEYLRNMGELWKKAGLIQKLCLIYLIKN